MSIMTEQESADFIISAVAVIREDIVRAKQWILASNGSNVSPLVDTWLGEQDMSPPSKLDAESPTYEETLNRLAKSLSLRLAFFQALWELIYAGELFPSGAAVAWSPKSIDYCTRRKGSGVDLSRLKSSYPERVERPRLAPVISSDVDIFLQGIDIKTLDSGIHEAIEQSLTCFRRGLYLPATVMLAAAVEATWTEMGAALAKKLSDAKLEAMVGDEQIGIAKKVSEIRKTIETNPGAKQVLSNANRTKYDVSSAEVWTTVLRERRNALHWGKAKSFLADHSETASLLMASQLHLATLEAIRLASK